MHSFVKIAAAAVAACVVAVMLPAAAANADTSKGSIDRCYSVKKKGYYNEVRVRTNGDVSGNNVAAHALLDIQGSGCTQPNAIPINYMKIYYATLVINGKNYTTNGHSNGSKSYVSVLGAGHSVSCSSTLKVAVKIGYDYYYGPKVTPFWIVGPAFHAC